MKSTDVLTKPMREAIARSGYLMEQRLVPLVEGHGFKATPNQRFRDPDTGAQRELDIFAISAARIGRRGTDFVFPILLIACKNLQCPFVFFAQDEVRLDVFLGKLQISGMPQDILMVRGRHQRLADFLKLQNFHHYYRTGRVSSQFCAVYESKRQAGGKKPMQAIFEAGHFIGGRIDLFADFEALGKALDAEKREHAESFDLDPRDDQINLQIYYPVFVTSGPLVECFVGKRRPKYRKVHRVGFLLRQAYTGKAREYRVDVVDEQGLKRLLEVIMQEADGIAKKIGRHRKVVASSILASAKRLRRTKKEFKLSYICGDRELF